MGTEFTQKDYILYQRFYDKVLKIFKRELEQMEKNHKKPLLYYRTKKTFEHLKGEKGRNLTPYDVDNLAYVLLHQIQKKKR